MTEISTRARRSAARWPMPLQYALAVWTVILAVGLRWLLLPVLGDRVPYITVFAALLVLVVTVHPGPFMVAAALGWLGAWMLIAPGHGRLALETPADVVQVAIFALAILVSAIAAWLSSRAHARVHDARQRAEDRGEALRVVLGSIGDAVIALDTQGRITYLNPVAVELTGCTLAEASGRPLGEVFRIVDGGTGGPAETSVELMLRGGEVELARHHLLLRRDGTELAIDDRAAPIRGADGTVRGVVLVFRDVSARRRAELARERSERELADFFDNAAVGLHSVGPDGTILRVNRSELEMLGYEREEYVGRHIAEFHVDRTEIEAMLRAVAAGDTLRNRPARIRAKDGSIREVLVDSSALFENGRLVRTRCFMRDMTEPNRAHDLQELLAAIVESSEEAILSKSLDGTIRSWNAAAERLFGHSAAEAIGRSIDLIVPLDHRDEEQEILARLARGERIDRFETIRVAKDGRRIDVLLSISPVRDRAGRIAGASAVASDITHRKQAEEQLRESETRFRMIADSAPVLMWLNDATGCVFVNRAYREFLGLSRAADLHGYHWARHVHPEDRSKYVAAYEAAVAARAPFAAEFRFRRWDCEYRWMRSMAEPRVTASSELLGYVGCTFDVHDAKTMAEALRDADRRKDEFLATLAHELRNPLAPIRNSLELMQLAEHDRGALERARETIARQLRHLVRLVDDLLDVGRITRNRLELRRARIDLEPVIRQAVEMLRPTAEQDGHVIDVELPAEPIVLDADPVRLAQVFGNLLDNACKYSPGGGTIRLRAERRDMEVIVAVQDEGAGISPDDLRNIFEMFARAGSDGGRPASGLGIGLALAKRLLELHGGSIEARSEGLGHGSEFLVRLPVPAPDADGGSPGADDAGVSSCPTDMGAARDAVGRRILVVDDSVDAAQTLAAFLGIIGHEAEVAHDGAQAIARGAAFEPDAVLLDIGLPDMNGYDTCRAIRQQPWGQEIVMVAVTGWGQAEDRRQSREAGFDAHLVKPVDPHAIPALLDELAGNRRLGREPVVEATPRDVESIPIDQLALRLGRLVHDIRNYEFAIRCAEAGGAPAMDPEQAELLDTLMKDAADLLAELEARADRPTWGGPARPTA